MTFKLPEPVAWLNKSGSSTMLRSTQPDDECGTVVEHWQPLYTARSLRDVLEQAAQEATDAVAFNGGTVQMEAHVREAIRKMIGEI